ncbi:hypothetical protein, partial [Streptomyces californicus]|uniref:hypothetical protein n=1 Tax=Streptomyces californicus TaxID=67351 RepID=UPI00364C483B
MAVAPVYLRPGARRGSRSPAAPLAGVRRFALQPERGPGAVDNGRIRFHGVRVPREALLNRFADVTPEG